MHVLKMLQLADSDQVSAIIFRRGGATILGSPVGTLLGYRVCVVLRAILGGDYRDSDSARSGVLRFRRGGLARIVFADPDKHISPVRHRIGARLIQCVGDIIGYLGKIAPAADSIKCRHDQRYHCDHDRNDCQQFDQGERCMPREIFADSTIYVAIQIRTEYAIRSHVLQRTLGLLEVGVQFHCVRGVNEFTMNLPPQAEGSME